VGVKSNRRTAGAVVAETHGAALAANGFVCCEGGSVRAGSGPGPGYFTST
jgi:hypothetical protein